MERLLGGLVVAALLAGCPTSGPAEPSHAPPPPPLDEPLPAGRARCGMVRTASETIGGPGAYLEPGRAWRCYNHLVRFGGGTREAAVGLALYGGSLLDADMVRADEASDGEDQFRELFPAPGFMGVNVTSVEVLRSGEDGGEAIIRVHGVSAPIGVLPQILLIEHRYDGEVITDFIMRPDVRHLEIVTTVYNNEARALDLTLGDFFAMGSGLRAFTPETGFGEAPLLSSVSVYAGTSPRVSYGYTVPTGAFTIPIVDAGGTGALVKQDVLISDQESYTRFFIVGDGSLASVLEEAAIIRGEPLGTLHVQLTQGGTPAEGMVTLLRADAMGRVANQLRVPAGGILEARVPPGEYMVKAGAHGSSVVTSGPVTITAGARTDHSADVPPPAHVTFTAHEVSSGGNDLGAIPAKLSVVALDAAAPDPDMDRTPERGLVTYAVSADGTLRASVPAGRYRFIVSRGPEYDLFIHEAELVAGENLQRDAPLVRVIDSTGLLAAEFHQHSLGSLDSNTDLLTKVVENAAEGVELAASTDHDNVTDYGPYVRAMGLDPFMSGWPGNEISYNGVGHFNAYPLAIDAADPFRDVGARLWAGRSVADLFAALRARPEDPVIHVSHPRATSGKGYFAQVKLDPVTGEAIGQTGSILTVVPPGTLTTLATDFDAVEVNDEIADPALLEPGSLAELQRLAREQPTRIPTMVDWFHLINTGRHVAALGNSDSHDRNSGSGWPRNHLVVDNDDPRAVTVDEARSAIREQRVVVGNGLLLVPRVEGRIRMGHSDPVATMQQELPVEITVESPAWAGGASSLLAFLGGRPLHLRLDGTSWTEDATAPAVIGVVPECDSRVCRAKVVIRVPSTSDTWLVVAARGGGSLSPVGSGSAWAYANPVYVDAGGDGWNP